MVIAGETMVGLIEINETNAVIYGIENQMSNIYINVSVRVHYDELPATTFSQRQLLITFFFKFMCHTLLCLLSRVALSHSFETKKNNCRIQQIDLFIILLC